MILKPRYQHFIHGEPAAGKKPVFAGHEGRYDIWVYDAFIVARFGDRSMERKLVFRTKLTTDPLSEEMLEKARAIQALEWGR